VLKIGHFGQVSFLDSSSRSDNEKHSMTILERLEGKGGHRTMPPPPRSVWTADQIELYRLWIADGFQP
jgi:hypothetical protein